MRRRGSIPAILLAASWLAGCGSGDAPGQTTPGSTAAVVSPSPAVDRVVTSPPATAAPTASVAPPAAPLAAHVTITPVKEPDDHAHRNYCGSGATLVLVSAFLPSIPDIETAARLAHLDPDRGQTGADTVVAINALLEPVAARVPGGAIYGGRHVTALADVVAALRIDIGGQRTAALGHGAPIMVQTMTRDLPGWNHWQATHMITIYAYDLRSGDPATETVSYAETPSPQAAYTGPPVQTIPLSLLWSAMVAHNTDAADDPVNLIS